MNNNLRSVLAITAIGLVALASCKKKSDESVKAKLTGEWKETKTAYDSNHNGVQDASELVTLSDSTGLTSFTLNGDGSGTVKFTYLATSSSSPITWSLINNDADVKLINPNNGAAPDTTTVHIESLSSSDLAFKSVGDDSTHSATWSYFHKQ